MPIDNHLPQTDPFSLVPTFKSRFPKWTTGNPIKGRCPKMKTYKKGEWLVCAVRIMELSQGFLCGLLGTLVKGRCSEMKTYKKAIQLVFLNLVSRVMQLKTCRVGFLQLYLQDTKRDIFQLFIAFFLHRQYCESQFFNFSNQYSKRDIFQLLIAFLLHRLNCESPTSLLFNLLAHGVHEFQPWLMYGDDFLIFEVRCFSKTFAFSRLIK